ncbi:MAG: hypothetical protein ACRDV9_01390, partial [Acidimicrobiia bacterium]
MPRDRSRLAIRSRLTISGRFALIASPASQMIDFTIPGETVAFLERLEAFLHEQVTPAEVGLVEEDFESGRVERDLLPPLREAARKAGVYTPQLAPR